MAVKRYIIAGEERDMFTSGDLAQALDRQRQTVRKWEARGVIPATPFRSRTGRRLYTREQMDAIISTVLEFGLKQGTPISQKFIAEVHRKFNEATPNY